MKQSAIHSSISRSHKKSTSMSKRKLRNKMMRKRNYRLRWRSLRRPCVSKAKHLLKIKWSKLKIMKLSNN